MTTPRSSPPPLSRFPSPFASRPTSPTGSSSPSSCVSSLEMDSTSPALATARSQGLGLGAATVAVLGLVSTTTRSYAAPEDFAFLTFHHHHGCPQACHEGFNTWVRRVVAKATPATMKEVETCVRRVLLGQGCSVDCGLAKSTTTGLFLRYNSDHGSVYMASLLLPSSSATPLPTVPCDSQVGVPESSFAPILDDGSFELPAGALLSKPGTPALDNTPAVGPSSIVPILVIGDSSPSTPSGLTELSSGEKEMYKTCGKRAFKLDRSSDEDYVPPGPSRPPPRPTTQRADHSRARSLSPIKSSSQKGIPVRHGFKHCIVPAADLFGGLSFPASSTVPGRFTDLSPRSPPPASPNPTPTPAPEPTPDSPVLDLAFSTAVVVGS